MGEGAGGEGGGRVGGGGGEGEGLGGVKGFVKYKITRDSSAIKFERGELAEHLFLVLFESSTPSCYTV